MDLTTLPLVWAQAQAQPAAPNPNSMYFLSLRRWCSSLTLSSPQAIPSLPPAWALLAGLAGLLILAVLAQGPIRVLQQLFNLAGHVRLVQKSSRRLWRAGRMVASVLKSVGLPDLIAETPEEYVSRAVEWAGDVGMLEDLRGMLRKRLKASPLCDGKAFTRGLEAAYRGMWRRWVST